MTNQTDTSNTIYPVILRVADKDRHHTGKDKVSALSRLARQALKISAQKSGILLTDLSKDATGAPLPVGGNYWSLTHKSTYVGAVVSPKRIGIDIEKIRPCSKSVFKKVADAEEWNLAGADPCHLFFRYWTAKEAVLKAAGTGIRGLSTCRVTQVVDDNRLSLTYREETWIVEHFFFDEHIAAVVKNACHIQWVLIS